MKNLFFLLVTLTFFTNAFCQQRVTCNVCNGYKALRCNSCNGSGIVVTQVWNPYMMRYQPIQQYCGYCGGRGGFTCSRCSGYGYLVVNNNNSPSFRGSNLVPVSIRTRKCDGYGGSLCSCTNYKGYKVAGTNTYKGKCTNYVNGHRCGHEPGDHGL